MSEVVPTTDEGPSVAAPPGPILQSATIGFRVIYIVTLLLGLLWFGSNFRIISSDNQAVVMQFGRVVATHKAGLVLAWPRPFEQVLLIPGAERQLSRHVVALPRITGISYASNDPSGGVLPEAATPYLTGDNKVVLFDATLIYRITDPVAYVLSQDHVLPALDRMFRTSAVHVAAGQQLNDFLVVQTADGADAQNIEATRGRVRDRLLANMNARLNQLSARGDGLGVEIDRIDMTPYLPPEAKIAFDAVLTAGQKADQNVAAANTAAERRRQGAQREADRLVSAAEAAALERQTNATVDTTSIMAIEQTSGSHAGLEDQAYRNTIGSVLAKAGNVVTIDANSGQRILMTGPPRPAAGAGR